VIVTILFFMWGLLTSLNDVLIPHLKAIYTLSYVQAMLVQFCFFGAYFIVSVPAGALIRRVGYQTGAVIGLLIAAVGCALFYPASKSGYGLFLFAFFVLASGITILQVAANPYVTVLGAASTASSRLTLTQAFNSLGTTIAPYVGGILILSGAAVGADQAGGHERHRTGGLPRA
jgi:FHS family L-fucose permease-like MFS transporter